MFSFLDEDLAWVPFASTARVRLRGPRPAASWELPRELNMHVVCPGTDHLVKMTLAFGQWLTWTGCV